MRCNRDCDCVGPCKMGLDSSREPNVMVPRALAASYAKPAPPAPQSEVSEDRLVQIARRAVETLERGRRASNNERHEIANELRAALAARDAGEVGK